MKSWKIKINLKGSRTIETIVYANTSYDAEKIVKLQYGSNMTGFSIPREVK